MLSYKIFGFQNVVQEPQIIQELCTRIDAGILHKHNVVCDFILDHLADASIAAPAISATPAFSDTHPIVWDDQLWRCTVRCTVDLLVGC